MPSATRWNRTALIWLAAFWLPVFGAYVHLLAEAGGRLAADAALVYVAALAVGLALVTAACVAAHALLCVVMRWLLASPAELWRRPTAAALCVAVGWLLAYEWTAWSMRLAGAFVAPQPLPGALARAIGLGVALAYLLLGLAVAGAPLLPALLPASASRPAAAAPRLPAAAPSLIAPQPYPLTRAAPAAAAPNTSTVTGASGGRPAAASAPRPTLPPPALDTPLLLRYPARPNVMAPPVPDAPRAAEPPRAPRVTLPIAPEARVVPVIEPPAAQLPRTVPVLPAVPQAAAPAPPEDGVRLVTDVYLDIVVDDQPST